MKPWARSEGSLTVKLTGRPPWGFRLQGGMGTGEPLKVYKVRKKGKSFNKLFIGDVILSVNGYSCQKLTYAEAMRVADAGAPDLSLLVIRSSGQSSKAPVKRSIITKTFSNGRSDTKSTQKVKFQVERSQRSEHRSVSLPYSETIKRKNLQKSYSLAKPSYLSQPRKISGKFFTMEEESSHDSMETPDDEYTNGSPEGNTEENNEAVEVEQVTSEAENYFSSAENTEADEQLEELTKESEEQSCNSEEFAEPSSPCDDRQEEPSSSPENADTMAEDEEQSYENEETQSAEAVSSECSASDSVERVEDSDEGVVAENASEEAEIEDSATELSECQESVCTQEIEETMSSQSATEECVSVVTRSEEVQMSSETSVQESFSCVSESATFSETIVQEYESETESETVCSEIVQESESVSKSATISSEVVQESVSVSKSEISFESSVQDSSLVLNSETVTSQEESVIQESVSVSESQISSTEETSKFISSQINEEQSIVSESTTVVSSEVQEQQSTALASKIENSQETALAENTSEILISGTSVQENVSSTVTSETNISAENCSQEKIQTVEKSEFTSALTKVEESEISVVQSQEITSSQTATTKETYATNLAEFEAHILQKLDKISKFNVKKFELSSDLKGAPLPIDEILSSADAAYQSALAQIVPMQLPPLTIPIEPSETVIEAPAQLPPSSLPPQPVAVETPSQPTPAPVKSESDAPKPKKEPPPVPPKPSRKTVHTPGMNGTAELIQSSVGMGAKPTDSCKEENFNINPKVYRPPADMDNMEITMLSRKKKMFSSSSFYEEPNCIYPTVEEQVQLCRKIADSLSADTNLKSKGASMFYKRVKRSETWVHEAQGQRNGEGWFIKSNDTGLEPSTPDLANRPYIRVSKGPPQLKLILDPRHIIDMKTLQQEGIIINEHNTITPDICLGIVRDLNSPTGKGAQMFARRKKKSEEWVVDEDRVKSSLTQRQTGINYNYNEAPHTWVQTAANQWEKFASANANYVGSYVDVHPDKVAETVIRAAENKISSIPEEKVFQPPPPLQFPDPLPPLEFPEPLPPLQPPEPLPQYPFQEPSISLAATQPPRPSTPSFKASLYSANPYKPRSPKPWAGATQVSSNFSQVQPVEMPVYTPPPPPPVMSEFPPPVTVPSAPVKASRRYNFQNFNTMPRAWQGAEVRHHSVLFRPVKAPSL